MREKGLIIAFHDVAPHSYEAFKAFAGDLECLGIDRFTWLVVPWWHGQSKLKAKSQCAQYLRRRASQGDALIAHGLTHRWEITTTRVSLKDLFIGRVYTDCESEFLGLQEAPLRDRVLLSRILLAQAELPVSGFVAPAWILPPWGLRVVREAGFSVTETYQHLYFLKDGRRCRAPVLTTSSRTTLRVFLSRFLVPALSRVFRESAVVRLAIHPADLEEPVVRNLIRSLAVNLCTHRQLYTLASWAEAISR